MDHLSTSPRKPKTQKQRCQVCVSAIRVRDGFAVEPTYEMQDFIYRSGATEDCSLGVALAISGGIYGIARGVVTQEAELGLTQAPEIFPTAAAESPEAINGASLDFITQGQAAKIQSAANTTQTEITLFGSRAKGTATPLSDWDYLMEANHSTRNFAKTLLPKGPANSGVNRIDLFKKSTFPHDISGQPQIIFKPNE